MNTTRECYYGEFVYIKSVPDIHLRYFWDVKIGQVYSVYRTTFLELKGSSYTLKTKDTHPVDYYYLEDFDKYFMTLDEHRDYKITQLLDAW